MQLDRREGFIWLDGQRVEWANASLHVLSHGLHYATAAFEGIRVYRGRPFKLKEHVDRLFYSCSVVGIELPVSRDILIEEIACYVDACGHADAYVRPLAWRGSEELGIIGDTASSHLAIACWPWKGPHSENARRSISVLPGEWRRPPLEAWPLQAKLSGLYSIGSINARKARAQGFDDALVLAPDGRHVAELTGANIFFVADGELITPQPNYALNGITRQTTIALAQALELELAVSVRDITLDEIARFDGAFATGTAYELIPIHAIGTTHYDMSSSRFTGVFDSIQAAYDELKFGGFA
ncbi:branched-chain amino acid aminotransferase [Pseudomonas syringae pv. theae ICMP 3923]|uniref:aminotransferase class IV n=1 Tax=Pseudomonas syringae TaxID=317 RepID=UPI000357DE8D|nr:aminotransferase class IV [Pseudomonas syringae]EPM67337.1 branched-chain amino acid aminotransferase [Pseudomonas syringae pv. theae ICMP 3923]KPZ34613.1 hypothetical protein AN901_203730 [Pseudomonas syringae pv. theae]MBL3831486.1 hypothetical protein [Pseudomonas syringae pv. theae]MBL3837322.1 hypothetical protein [Pseudomonas syringae pv. theae]MBL3870526.1 hypothetical protein [Pseudomonas syringae pv. theae]